MWDFLIKYIPVLISLIALFFSILNTIKPKIDSEYNICLSSVRRSQELWDEYNCPDDGNDDSEKTLLKILNNAERAFIYINSRHYFFKSVPLKHLEQEIIEPFTRCLRKNNDSSEYLRKLIKDNITGETTFAELKKALKRSGIKNI